MNCIRRIKNSSFIYFHISKKGKSCSRNFNNSDEITNLILINLISEKMVAIYLMLLFGLVAGKQCKDDPAFSCKISTILNHSYTLFNVAKIVRKILTTWFLNPSFF